MNISIALTVEGEREIQIVPILNEDDIDKALNNSKLIIKAMLEKHSHQKAYQKRFGIEDTEILQNFNGDALYIAMGIRSLDEEDVANIYNLSEQEIIQMSKGLIKPSKAHCELFVDLFQFPASHFTSDIEYHDPKFKCLNTIEGYA